jgi:homoserine O-acetyltransferase
LKNSRYYIVPASPDTRGHGTTGAAKFWKDELAKHLAATPRRAM